MIKPVCRDVGTIFGTDQIDNGPVIFKQIKSGIVIELAGNQSATAASGGDKIINIIGGQVAELGGN